MHNLIFSGGVGHPFADTSDMLAELLAPLGIETDIAAPDRWEAAIAGHPGPGVGMITFNALRWRMLAERYGAQREADAYLSTPTLRRFVDDHLEAGGGLLSIHTSCICFDDWSAWADILGAGWDWDRSFHPVLADGVEVQSLLDGSTFTATDEVYHGLHVTDPDRHVVATATVPLDSFILNPPPLGAEGLGDAQPVIWTRRHGTGRVVVDTLGHDHRSLGLHDHRRILLTAVQWATGTVEP